MKSDTRYSNRKPGVKTERPVRDMRAQRTQKEQNSAADRPRHGPRRNPHGSRGWHDLYLREG